MNKDNIHKFFARLREIDPHPTSDLEWTNNYTLLVAVTLSAQSTDKGVNKAELQDRLQLYKDLRTGLISLGLQITLSGRPLPGAEVVLTPEPFVAEVVQPASGTTDRYGMVYPTSDTAEVPGIQPGFYRIEIKSPHIKSEKAMQAAKSHGVEASPVSDGEGYSSGTIIKL